MSSKDNSKEERLPLRIDSTRRFEPIYDLGGEVTYLFNPGYPVNSISMTFSVDGTPIGEISPTDISCSNELSLHDSLSSREEVDHLTILSQVRELEQKISRTLKERAETNREKLIEIVESEPDSPLDKRFSRALKGFGGTNGKT